MSNGYSRELVLIIANADSQHSGFRSGNVYIHFPGQCTSTMPGCFSNRRIVNGNAIESGEPEWIRTTDLFLRREAL